MPRGKAAPKKKETTKTEEKTPTTQDVLDCKQAVADELKLSIYQFSQLLRKYPFNMSGCSGKLNGRWHVLCEDVWKWYRYVKSQELRHPDSRRRRPVESPEIQNIQGR